MDVVFKRLLEDERLLHSIIEAVLDLKNVQSTEILNPGIPADIPTGKSVVLDVRVALADGTLLDIEMQGRSHAGLASRLLLYWARLYSEQLRAGEDYGKLRPTKVICWINDRIVDNELFHNTYELRNVEDHRPWVCRD